MKRFTISCWMLVTTLLFSTAYNKAEAQEQGSVSYQDFYDDLSPYGHWIDYPEYGYVWSPDVGSDFKPYHTNGHWVWTEDYEWTWVSDYEWGWAPFHYGRWFYDDINGWLWIPGYEWSPAWVIWRNSDEYFGWAPLGPQAGVNIDLSFGRYAPPVDYWSFVPCGYITSPYLNNYYLDWRRNGAVFNNTVIINNIHRYHNVFVTGPGRGEVERFTHERIRPAILRESFRPGRTEFRNNEVRLYHPFVNHDNGRRFAPAQFDRYNRNSRNEVSRGRDNNNRFFNNDNRQRDYQNRNNNSPVFDRREGIIQNRGDNNNRRGFFGNRENQQNNNGRDNRHSFEQRSQQQYEQPAIRQPRQENQSGGRGRNEASGNDQSGRNGQGNNFQRGNSSPRPERQSFQRENNNSRQQSMPQPSQGQGRQHESGNNQWHFGKDRHGH